MIPLSPIKLYRPTRVKDNAGGFTEVLGSATTIYGVVRVDESGTQMVFNLHTDVRPGDVVAVRKD